ncbi:MAG: Gfo/Idh/MocA family oxidoreductase [Spirochaetes bacterium]|nr:Gfo/Idh/MocA family oxidoreductase [Spirochaetota bacterium]
MKPVGFAIIGAGGIAQSQHLPNLSRADGVALRTICDRDAATLAKAVAAYPGARGEADFQQVLKDPEIEAVLIATRPESHVPLTLAALAAGKHVYVEKPLAETEAECRSVVEAQKKSGKRVAIGMNRRLAPAYVAARDLMWRHGGPMNLGYRICDSYSLNWGLQYGAGNRIVHELCHIFDILRFFTKSEVTRVHCVSSRPDDESLTLVFASGCIATIQSSGYATVDYPKERLDAICGQGALCVEEFAELVTYGLDDEERRRTFRGRYHPAFDVTGAELVKSGGSALVQELRRAVYEATREEAQLAADGAKGTRAWKERDLFIRQKAPNVNYLVNKGWIEAVEDFAACIRSGKEPGSPNAEDGLAATRITQAAMKSRERGGEGVAL